MTKPAPPSLRDTSGKPRLRELDPYADVGRGTQRDPATKAIRGDDDDGDGAADAGADDGDVLGAEVRLDLEQTLIDIVVAVDGLAAAAGFGGWLPDHNEDQAIVWEWPLTAGTLVVTLQVEADADGHPVAALEAGLPGAAPSYTAHLPLSGDQADIDAVARFIVFRTVPMPRLPQRRALWLRE